MITIRLNIKKKYILHLYFLLDMAFVLKKMLNRILEIYQDALVDRGQACNLYF
jgi:hypothetical protein